MPKGVTECIRSRGGHIYSQITSKQIVFDDQLINYFIKVSRLLMGVRTFLKISLFERNIRKIILTLGDSISRLKLSGKK